MLMGSWNKTGVLKEVNGIDKVGGPTEAENGASLVRVRSHCYSIMLSKQ